MSDQQPESRDGDNINVGNIENSNVVAVGAGATAVYNAGLSTEAVAALVIELKRVDQPKVWDGRFPYLGLTAFQESDAQFFFGREGLVDELLERVEEARFIVIAGPSGSGKSSVARAGLFHALREGRLDKSDGWLLAAMQPKGDPIEQLALAMARLAKSPSAGDHLRQQGRENPLALHEQVETLLGDDSRQRCVLLVDQFEETFTQTKEEDRAAFIGLLTKAAGVENGRVTVILSLRADFISHCVRYPDLRALMNKQLQLVGAMDPSDLAKAITLPSLEVGSEIDPALVSRIMADMKGEPGALPLMSFALRDLFEAEKSAKSKPMDLTLPEYLQRGGIESALERHANTVFDTFTDEQKGVARGVFSKLIEVGQGRADTRRTAVFKELVPSGVEAEVVTAVVDALAQEGVRLITTSGSGGTVTIAHEKLIDAWPWLRQLIDENREMIVLQNQINDDAKSWAEKDDSGYLYRGGQLIQVEEQLKASNPDLNKLSQEFIQASLDQRQQEIEEKEAQQRREIEQAQQLAEEQRQRAEAEQRRSALFRKALIGGGVLLLFLMAAMIFAWIQTGIANENLNIANLRGTAESNALATSEAEANARATAVVEAQISETHANESLNIANLRGTAEANALATSEAESHARATAVVEAQTQQLIASSGQALALSRNELLSGDPMQGLAYAITSHAITSTTETYENLIWSLNAARTISIRQAYDQAIGGGGTNPSNDTFIAVSGQNISIGTIEEPRSFINIDEHDDTIVDAHLSDDGRFVVTADAKGNVHMFEITSGALIWSNNIPGITTISISSDSEQLAVGSSDTTIYLFTPLQSMDDQPVTVFQHTNWGFPLEVNFSPDGTLLAAAYHDGVGRIWDRNAPDVPTTVLISSDSQGPMRQLVFSPNNIELASFNDDDTVRLWEVESGRELAAYKACSGFQWKTLEFNSSGENLAIGCKDGTIGLISFDSESASGNGQVKILRGANLPINKLSFSGNGHYIVAGGEDAIVRLWAVDSGRLIHELRGHEGSVRVVDVSGDDQHLITMDTLGQIRIWDIAFDHILPFSIEMIGGSPININQEDGSVLLALPTQIVRWSPENYTIDAILTNLFDVDLVVADPQLNLIAIAHIDNTIEIYTLDQPSQEPMLVKKINSDIHDIAFDLSGEHLIIGSQYGRLYTWDIQEDQLIELFGHTNDIFDVSLFHHSPIVVSGSSDGTVRLWNYEMDELVYSIDAIDSAVLKLAISPDDRYLAVSTVDSHVTIWDITGNLPNKLTSFTGTSSVHALVFNENGEQLLLGDANGQVYMWNWTIGEQFTYPNKSERIVAIALDVERSRFFIVDINGNVSGWPLTAESANEVACERLTSDDLALALQEISVLADKIYPCEQWTSDWNDADILIPTEYNSLFSQLEQKSNQLPHIKYFEVPTGSRIQNGESVKFQWDVSGELQTFFIRGEQGTEGVVSPGSTTSHPTRTSVYTLIARNDYGEVRQSIEVIVYP